MVKRRLRFMSLVLAAALAAPPSIGTAGSLPDPAKVTVQSISFAGSGCPTGTVSHSLNADRTALTLTFTNYIAKLGPGIASTENRKNCQLTVNLKYPAGWQYRVSRVDYRGYVQLSSGTSGTLKDIFYFQGDSTQVSTNSNLVGPQQKD